MWLRVSLSPCLTLSLSPLLPFSPLPHGRDTLSQVTTIKDTLNNTTTFGVSDDGDIQIDRMIASDPCRLARQVKEFWS